MNGRPWKGTSRRLNVGGAAALGIRHSDGTIFMAEVWTNILPWLLVGRNFLNEGEDMGDFQAKAKPTNSWPESRKVPNRLIYSEYGVILVDCREKVIFSRQDYCHPGEVPIGLDLIQGDYEEINQYISQGWPFQFVHETWDPDIGLVQTPFTKELHDQTMLYIKADKPVGCLPVKGIFKLVLDLSPWKIDHRVSRPSRDKATAKEVRAFYDSWVKIPKVRSK